MNKRMWNDLYLNRDLGGEDLKRYIRHSYDEVVRQLPKKYKEQIEQIRKKNEKKTTTIG